MFWHKRMVKWRAEPVRASLGYDPVVGLDVSETHIQTR